MYWWRLLTLLLCVSCNAFGNETSAVRKVRANLIIGDAPSACHLALEELAQYPNSAPLQAAYIEALGACGDEKGMLSAWNQYSENLPESRQVIEVMSWKVIEKGAHSSSPIIRLLTILAAFFSQDARGVVLVDRGLHDHSMLVRRGAIQLAGRLRDARVGASMLNILQNEKAWHLRLEAIKAVGGMQLKESKEVLEQILVAGDSTDEEKGAAIASLVQLTDSIERQELLDLLNSPRAALRMLACAVVAHLELEEGALIQTLLQDPHAQVRTSAIHTIARMESIDLDLLKRALQDPDPHVAIAAGWLLTKKGERHLDKWLTHPDKSVRLIAAAALADTGPAGVQQMHEAFQNSDDLYVRMTLALGMIGEQVEIDKCCDVLFEGLQKDSKRWMWKEYGPYRAVAQSDVKHHETIPNYPEGINQVTRLEVLNVLALMEYPLAQEALKGFLQEKGWGISGMASALLLTEGDEESLDLVKELLNDKEEKLRLQAALTLAMWGRDPQAVDHLLKVYPSANRDTKEHILEALARIGDSESIPFLVERLKEPSQTLRIIAAAALLQTLYH